MHNKKIYHLHYGAEIWDDFAMVVIHSNTVLLLFFGEWFDML